MAEPKSKQIAQARAAQLRVIYSTLASQVPDNTPGVSAVRNGIYRLLARVDDTRQGALEAPRDWLSGARTLLGAVPPETFCGWHGVFSRALGLAIDLVDPNFGLSQVKGLQYRTDDLIARCNSPFRDGQFVQLKANPAAGQALIEQYYTDVPGGVILDRMLDKFRSWNLADLEAVPVAVAVVA